MMIPFHLRTGVKSWNSNSEQCSFGDYGSGSRQMNCGFTCQISLGKRYEYMFLYQSILSTMLEGIMESDAGKHGVSIILIHEGTTQRLYL